MIMANDYFETGHYMRVLELLRSTQNRALERVFEVYHADLTDDVKEALMLTYKRKVEWYEEQIGMWLEHGRRHGLYLVA